MRDSFWFRVVFVDRWGWLGWLAALVIVALWLWRAYG